MIKDYVFQIYVGYVIKSLCSLLFNLMIFNIVYGMNVLTFLNVPCGSNNLVIKLRFAMQC